MERFLILTRCKESQPNVAERPSWQYPNMQDGRSRGNFRLDQLEMQESIRNVLEQILDKQMLQCDVAGAIKSMAHEMRGLRRDLRARRKKTSRRHK